MRHSLQQIVAPSIRQSKEPRFIVGQDRMGRWIVQDRAGLLGGMFVTEQAAVHFARQEADHDPALVCMAPAGEILELDAPTVLRSHLH